MIWLFPCVKLTVGEVDVLGDLVPGAVVEMADLLLVLNHAGWLSLLPILQRYVGLDGFKILPMLKEERIVCFRGRNQF